MLPEICGQHATQRAMGEPHLSGLTELTGRPCGTSIPVRGGHTQKEPGTHQCSLFGECRWLLTFCVGWGQHSRKEWQKPLFRFLSIKDPQRDPQV